MRLRESRQNTRRTARIASLTPIRLDEVLKAPEVDLVRDSLLEPGDVLLLDAEAVIHRIVNEDAKQPLKLGKLDALKRPLANKAIVGFPLKGGQYALYRRHPLTLARGCPPASLPAYRSLRAAGRLSAVVSEVPNT